MRISVLIAAFGILFACHNEQAETEKSAPPNESNVVTDTVKAYTAAIKEYLKEFCKTDKPDTLFLSRNEEFPDIILPATIENTTIRVIVTEEGREIAKRRPMKILNMISWLAKDKAEFMMVTFKDGYAPQFNCSMYFTYNTSEFKLDSLKTTDTNGKPLKR